MESLGVDIGGVVIARVDPRSDTSFFGDNYLETPAVPGAIEALRRLAEERFGENLFLVSKCGLKTEQRTREWLSHHLIYARTGLDPERLHFCRQRHEKAPICKALGITHFVDDRLEVLGYLESVPHRYLFNADAAEVAANVQHLPDVTPVDGWAEILRELLG
ncbi:hypothetical protein [Pelagibius sp.]|uniref:hypothetical protein n=1 Tax=Pelagibius sp. TaxID=1931238 RepID=UPI0026254DEE|nr:hypothetical protein [Pelagibius sp.]